MDNDGSETIDLSELLKFYGHHDQARIPPRDSPLC